MWLVIHTDNHKDTSKARVNMAHLLSDLANYFKLDEINIDNWTFKLYYKVSMVICMTGATVGIASQYFGDPIR